MSGDATNPVHPGSCAIMQPTFLPWLGYFSLIAQVEDFVFLDNVLLSKRSWQRRNQVSGPQGPVLLSLPVATKPSYPPICEARIAEGPFEAKLIARIRGSLGMAPHWPLVEDLLANGLARRDEGLAALNIGLIRDICAAIGLPGRFHRASEMDLPEDDKADRLHRIAARLGSTTYVSAVGSAGYLAEGHPFSEDGIRLRFMTYAHPAYRQKWAPFQSHMSVVDALAWTGPEATRALILDGIGPLRRLEEVAPDPGEDPET